MASAISTTSIDATFPVAGQDNDSQGFRDNFSQIKTQLDTASSEITTIQTNQAVTNATTDFNGHDIQNAILIDVGQKLHQYRLFVEDACFNQHDNMNDSLARANMLLAEIIRGEA